MTTPDELERAVERLEKALKIADQYAAGVHFGKDNDGFVSFATILALISERAELLATVERMRGALEEADRRLSRPDWTVQRDVTRTAIRAALTTGEATTPNAGERG